MQTESHAAQQDPVSSTEQEQQQTQQPAETGSVTGAEQSSQQQQDDAQQQQQKPKSDWAQRRIDQLTREKYEERRQREAVEAQLRQYQPQQTNDTTQTARHGAMGAEDVRTAAQELVKQERFDEACNKTFDAGKKDFPDFEQSLRTFGMLGGASQDFLEMVTDMDGGHKVIHHLGSNPEEAERVLSLSPLRMARELARIESQVSKAPPISRAPPPITPVGGRAAPPEPSEFASTADYIAWRKANRK